MLGQSLLAIHSQSDRHEELNIFPIDLRKFLKFNKIDAPLTQFALRYERAWLIHQIGYLNLRQPSVLSRLNQAAKKRPVCSLISTISGIHEPTST